MSMTNLAESTFGVATADIGDEDVVALAADEEMLLLKDGELAMVDEAEENVATMVEDVVVGFGGPPLCAMGKVKIWCLCEDGDEEVFQNGIYK